jgi:hypothetical protein
MFRSGSTLTEQVLAGHSRVVAGGELDLIPTLAQTELAPFPARMAEIPARELEELAARYPRYPVQPVSRRPARHRQAPGQLDLHRPHQNPLSRCAIIHTTRHPLDNCLSIHFLHLDHSMGYALDLIDTAHYYRQYRRLMAHWNALYGRDILDFPYDAFVREPRPAVEKLLGFCGLDWEEDCLSFHRVRNAVKTASVWQVREPLYQRSSGRWRNYARHLAPLREYLGELCDP